MLLKRILLIIFSLLLLSSPVYSATHYVSATGSATWGNSTDIGQPCSLATANANAAADDVVYLRAGTYTTSLNPTNSGSSGHPITFAAYPGSAPYEVAYLNGPSPSIDFTDGQDWIVIDGLSRNKSGNYSTLRSSGADNIEIKNCHFTSNNQGWYVFVVSWDSNNWSIHDNTFDVGSRAIGGGRLLQIGDEWWIGSARTSGHYIYDNVFVDGLYHDYVSITKGENIVFKDNTFYNTGLGSPCDGEGLQEMLIIYYKSQYILIEGNTFYEGGADIDNVCTISMHVQNSSNLIFRKNIVYKMDGFAIDLYENDDGDWTVEHNAVYNNTFYDTLGSYGASNYYGTILLAAYQDPAKAPHLSVRHNYFVNNILSMSGKRAFTIDAATTTYLYENYWYGNHLYNITQADEVNRILNYYNITEAQISFPDEFYDNSPNDNVDPKLHDPANGDMTLDADSGCIDTGQWLTTISSSTGSGTTFTVDNPYFFQAISGITGWTGDVIKTENGQTGTISSINYGTGQITLTSAISWVQNEGIALDYAGVKPDIGAEEYSSPAPGIGLENPNPANGETGVGITTDLTWTNGDGVTDVDVYFDDADCTTKVVDGVDTETYDTGTMAFNDVFYWKVVVNPDADNISYPSTGCYTFTTTQTPALTGSAVYDASGGAAVYGASGPAWVAE